MIWHHDEFAHRPCGANHMAPNVLDDPPQRIQDHFIGHNPSKQRGTVVGADGYKVGAIVAIIPVRQANRTALVEVGHVLHRKHDTPPVPSA